MNLEVIWDDLFWPSPLICVYFCFQRKLSSCLLDLRAVELTFPYCWPRTNTQLRQVSKVDPKWLACTHNSFLSVKLTLRNRLLIYQKSIEIVLCVQEVPSGQNTFFYSSLVISWVHFVCSDTWSWGWRHVDYLFSLYVTILVFLWMGTLRRWSSDAKWWSKGTEMIFAHKGLERGPTPITRVNGRFLMPYDRRAF